jgi:eukaryotic-like serine/threonine-protein kinase
MAEPVRTIEEFLAVTRKSGLVDAARLEEAIKKDWPDWSQPLPEEFVQRLIDTSLLTKWQADQLRKGRSKGFTLGKYTLRGLIGAGGMSSVYLAEHATLHNLVAIKVLPVKRVDKSSYLARFEREAQAAARLSHPNIVRAFDLGTADTIHYIAMEYVDGIDLHQKVKRDGPLPLRDAVDAVRQAALGLHFAHEEGFVHRDIKPANLIVDKRGTVKILDLGLAFAGGEEEDSLTREHNEKVLGTADYLAPEQARDSHAADRRSDIYALGCTLYYLLVGRPPFAKGTLAERIQAHLHQTPPNLLVEATGVPSAIADLYFRMLEKHPDARPQSAKEIADSLDAWLRSATPAAGGTAPTLPRRELPRRGGPGDSGVRPAATAGRSGIDAVPALASRAAPPLAPPVLRPPGARNRAGSDIRIATNRPPAAAKKPESEEPEKPAKSRRQLNFLGLPLGLWLVGLGLLVLIGVLGFMVFGKKKSTRNAKPQPASEQTDVAAGETATEANPADDAAAEPEPETTDATGPAKPEPKPAVKNKPGSGPKKPDPGKPDAKKEKPDDKPRPRGPLDDAIEQAPVDAAAPAVPADAAAPAPPAAAPPEPAKP